MLKRDSQRIATFAIAMSALAASSAAAHNHADAEPMPPGFAATTINLPQRDHHGEFMTPNRDQRGARAFWQLRIGLNVAAIGCRGPEEARLTSDYNRLIARHTPLIRSSETSVISELARSQGGNGIAARDRLSTRMFNYFAQPPVHEGFCARAASITAQVASLPSDAALAEAPALLAQLDQPFIDFYEDYARWQIAHAAWRALGNEGDQRREGAGRVQMAGGTKSPAPRDGQ